MKYILKEKINSINKWYSDNIFAINSLLIISFISFILLMVRNMAIPPVVFGDEWAYNHYSRQLSIKDSAIPSYLYLIIYRITSVFWDYYYLYVKLINVLFFIASGPFIYLISRKYTTHLISIVITLLSILGPISIYTSLFMPESMYFFFFWVLTYFCLLKHSCNDMRYGAVIGIIIAIMSLVKVHGVFLLVVVSLFLVVQFLYKKHSFKSLLVISFLILILFISVRLSLGYLFAGKSGFSIFGAFYSDVVKDTLPAISIIEKIKSFIFVLFGHLQALVVLFFIPIAVIIKSFFSMNRFDDEKSRIVSYSAAVLVTLVFIVSVFTVGVSNTYPQELIGRLHIRYYNFVFPLFLIIGASFFKKDELQLHSPTGYVIVSIILSIMIYAFFFLVKEHIFSWEGTPEFIGLRSFLSIIIIIGLFVFIVWLVDHRRGMLLYIFVFIVSCYIMSDYKIIKERYKFRPAKEVYDESGMIVKKLLGSKTDAPRRIKIIGNSETEIYRAALWIDNPHLIISYLPDNHKITISEFLKEDIDWLLLIGKYNYDFTPFSKLVFDGYELVKVPRKRYQFNLYEKLDPSLALYGFSSKEDTGRWIENSDCKIKFNGLLPNKFTLRIRANVYGFENGCHAVIIINTQKKQIVLNNGDNNIYFNFNLDKGEDEIKISLAETVLLKQNHLTDVESNSGILFREIEIIDHTFNMDGTIFGNK